MSVDRKTLGCSLAAILAGAVLAASTVHAQSRGEAPGYVTDSEGNIFVSGAGECWHSSTWTRAMANVAGCDGVVVNTKPDVFVGGPSGLVTGVVIPAATLFAFDSAKLSDAGKEALRDYRSQLRPELTKAFEAVIIGYTDSTGNADYNVGLSKRRADSVRDYLVSIGVPAEKLRTVGRGKSDPIASNDTAQGRAQNRRVEIFVIGEVRALDAMVFPSVALFPRRSAELTAQGKQRLEKDQNEARDMLQRAVYIEVIGHTDDVGGEQYNLELSEQRARAVRDYLVSTGVDPTKIVITGAGQSKPIASNRTEEGRAQNRRVEVLVLGRLR